MNTDFDLYNEILAAGPSPGTLFLILAKMKEEGGYKRVIQECIKALMIHPSDILLRKLLAETYLADGQASMAENEFLKVSGYIHDLASIYKSQAQIYLKQKREGDAKEALRLYLAYCPDDDEAFDLLSSLALTDEKAEPGEVDVDREEGMSRYSEETIASEDHRLPDIATPTLAEIYFRQGQIRDAKEMYEKIVADHPNDGKSLQRLEELRALLWDEKIEERVLSGLSADREPGEAAIDEPVSISFDSEAWPAESVIADPAGIKAVKIISVLEKWLGRLQDSTRYNT